MRTPLTIFRSLRALFASNRGTVSTAGFLVLFLAAGAVDGFADSITGQANLHLLQDAGTCANGIVYTGVFAGGCDVNLSGYGIYGLAAGETKTGGATFTNTANGQASTVSVSGGISGTSPGLASPTVTLGSAASIAASNVASGFYSSDTTAIFTSDIDVSQYTPGTPYIFNFDFNLTGTSSSSGGGRAVAEVFVMIGGSAWCPGGCTALWYSGFTGDASFSTDTSGNLQNYVYVRPNPSVTTTSLIFELRTIADDSGAGFVVGGDTAADADFIHTLTLTGAVLENFNGTPVPGGRIVDTSGFVFSDVGASAPAPVPEPSTLVLLGGGLLGLSRRRRQTR